MHELRKRDAGGGVGWMHEIDGSTRQIKMYSNMCQQRIERKHQEDHKEHE